MSVNLEHKVRSQNITSLQNVHKPPIMPSKTKPTNCVKSGKNLFTILQHLLVNTENKSCSISLRKVTYLSFRENPHVTHRSPLWV